MALEYEKRINQIKESLDKAKNMRIRAETRLEQLNKQKEEILEELKTLGVAPEQLDGEIERLRSEIEDLLGKAEKLIPEELIKKSN
jgi:chromosome segregation ATPase